MPPLSNLLRLALIAVLPLLSASCASVLTTWHDQAYTTVVPATDPLVEAGGSPRDVEQVADLGAAADELYAQGYVLLGYTKFTHTLVPGFQAMYAKLYAGRIGAERTVQAEPQRDGNVYAYTVTYWARAAEFPLGAYFNDVPDETALMFPDSLREQVAPGDRPVLVEAVVYGSPAEAAGVKSGELIVGIDGQSFAGCEGLDALVPTRANQEVTVTIWGLDGLRESTCTIGERVAGAGGPGPEGLYFNQPWAFEDYRNFQQYSEAFTDAWHAGIEAQRQAEVRARRDADAAYMHSRTASLEGRIADLERQPSTRGTRGGGIDLQQLRADGARNWDRFRSEMDWD